MIRISFIFIFCWHPTHESWSPLAYSMPKSGSFGVSFSFSVSTSIVPENKMNELMRKRTKNYSYRYSMDFMFRDYLAGENPRGFCYTFLSFVRHCQSLCYPNALLLQVGLHNAALRTHRKRLLFGVDNSWVHISCGTIRDIDNHHHPTETKTHSEIHLILVEARNSIILIEFAIQSDEFKLLIYTSIRFLCIVFEKFQTKITCIIIAISKRPALISLEHFLQVL